MCCCSGPELPQGMRRPALSAQLCSSLFRCRCNRRIGDLEVLLHLPVVVLKSVCVLSLCLMVLLEVRRNVAVVVLRGVFPHAVPHVVPVVNSHAPRAHPPSTGTMSQRRLPLLP